MALVAAVLKLTVAAAVAVLHSVHSLRLRRLLCEYRYPSRQFYASQRHWQDTNGDYNSEATWHPVSSFTLYFGTPCECVF